MFSGLRNRAVKRRARLVELDNACAIRYGANCRMSNRDSIIVAKRIRTLNIM